ncbi:complement C1s subcomponent-like [Haemaphysalis longicornis]
MGGYYASSPGKPTRTAVCTNNKWILNTNNPLVCRPVSCGSPFGSGVVIPHGRADSLVFNFPTIIKITCDPGYRLVAHDGSEWGTKILQCQSDGKWNRPAPMCIGEWVRNIAGAKYVPPRVGFVF